MPELQKLTLVAPNAANCRRDIGQATLLIFGCSHNLIEDLSLLAHAVQRYSPLRSLALYDQEEVEFARKAVPLGVAGYVPKAASPTVIRASISLLHVGGRCFLPFVGQRSAGTGLERTAWKPSDSPTGPAAPARLTSRQVELLGLLAAGHEARAIGEQMGVTVATVRCHANKLYYKLQARNRAEAVFIASRLGLV